MRAVLLTTAVSSGLLLAICAGAAVAAPGYATEECERLAAHPAEPGRRGDGVVFELIDPERATRACEAAVAEWREPLNLTRLARAYLAADRAAEARALAEEAAGLGDAHATAQMALHHVYGYDGRAEPATGHAIARKLIERPDAPPLAHSIVAHEFHTAEPPDMDAAMRHYRIAADGGDPTAMYWVAVILRSRGMPEDAAPLFDRAAQIGLPVAAHEYGLLLEAGRHAPQDPSRAAALLAFAAEHKVADAAADLARMHFDGIGVAKDDAAALRWAQAASDAGSGYGSYLLGFAHSFGRGVPADPVRGADHWDLAVDRGNLNATIALAGVFVDGVGRQRDLARAEELIATARATYPEEAARLERRIAEIRSGATAPAADGSIDPAAVAVGVGALLLLGLMLGGDGGDGGGAGSETDYDDSWSSAPQGSPWGLGCAFMDDLEQALAGC